MSDHVGLAGKNEYLEFFAVCFRGEGTDCKKRKQEGDAELVQNCIFHDESIVWSDYSWHRAVTFMVPEVDILDKAKVKNPLQALIRYYRMIVGRRTRIWIVCDWNEAV